jgi:hypothetical protein
MQKSNELQLKKLEIHDRESARILDLVSSMLANPVVMVIAGVTIVEQLQIHKIIGNVEKYGLYTAIAGDSMLSALSKSGILASMLKSGETAAAGAGTIVKDVLPLLLAAGAAA